MSSHLFTRTRAWARSALLLLVIAGSSSACTYDADDVCGPNEELYGDHVRCVCVAGAAFTENGCVLCGAHELPAAKGCACEAGYVAGAAGCELAPVGLGAACGVENPCTDATYDHCAGAEPRRYCTSSGCTSSGQCTGGYECDSLATPAICRRPPLGLMKSCVSNADCEQGEATFCDTAISHACLVQGCELAVDDCFTGYECCDLSAYGVVQPLCVEQGTCAP